MTLVSDKMDDNSLAVTQNIIEGTVQNFMHEVIQTSLQMPVLVYFTAPWCGPCKQFGPTLEKVVNDAEGRLKLVKVNVDAHPQLAQQFRIQSVPMVYIFVNGQPADGFSGAMQESQLKQLLSQFLAATPEEEDAKAMLVAAKELFESGNVEEALRYYHALLEHDKDNVEIITGLALCYITLDDIEQAEALLATVPEASHNNEMFIAAKAKLSLLKSAPGAELTNKFYELLKKNPADHQTRYDLAGALFAAGKAEEAISELLNIISADKVWNDNAARTQLLTIFEALGFENPLAAQGRRKLSAILFK